MTGEIYFFQIETVQISTYSSHPQKLAPQDPQEDCHIKLLEYPIPAPALPSQKPSHGGISRTKRGIIDPLLSKRQEKIQFFFSFFR